MIARCSTRRRTPGNGRPDAAAAAAVARSCTGQPLARRPRLGHGCREAQPTREKKGASVRLPCGLLAPLTHTSRMGDAADMSEGVLRVPRLVVVDCWWLGSRAGHGSQSDRRQARAVSLAEGTRDGRVRPKALANAESEWNAGARSHFLVLPNSLESSTAAVSQSLRGGLFVCCLSV